MDLKKNRKEIVLSRLKQSAAKVWGYQESEIEGFDPVVDLLFGACASEFERLSSELYRSQTRILEKVAQILLPEVYLCPVPAYAVINGKPLTHEKFTKQEDLFVIEKEVSGNASKKPEQKKLFFSPVPDFRLIDGEIALIATSHEIFQINDFLNKEALMQSGKDIFPHKNRIWLGLKINTAVQALNEVSFYFDWFNNPEKTDLLNLLRMATWSINGEKICVKNGFNQKIEQKYTSVIPDITSFLDINVKTEKKINHFFEDHFVTIVDNVLPEKRKYPVEFKDFFDIEELDGLKEELHWIEIEFPEAFPAEQLASAFCTPTAFPVINRKLHNSNRPYALNKDLNIIPITTEDYFYTLRSIISENQVNYREVPFKKVSDVASGTYTIRTEGVKRFDQRDAYEYMHYMIELLREEHVAFKSLGNSLIDNELNDLQVIINRLRFNISKSKNGTHNTHFAILKSELEEDVWIEYWSTTGKFGNNIPMGTLCQNTDFDKKGLKFLTTTTGGKNPPDQTEKISLFKNELLTRSRLVTREDIKAACYAELGNELKDVKISHRPILSNNRNSGFQNCIHVTLYFVKNKSAGEKESLASHVEKTLQQKSSCIYKYHVEAVN